MIVVLQGGASARKLIIRALARVLPTLWKFSAEMLVQAPHIAISIRRPSTLGDYSGHLDFTIIIPVICLNCSKNITTGKLNL